MIKFMYVFFGKNIQKVAEIDKKDIYKIINV